MALSANTVLEVRNGGSDTNGGGFVTGASGTDWSLQNTAQYSVTDGVTAGTTTITSATAAFGTDVVGNLVYVQGGTGSVAAGWYQITARSDASTITVDRSTGLTAGTGVTLRIGGALASPGQAAAIATVAGMTTFIKYHASPYVVTTASTNTAAGCVSGATNTAYVGYDSTRSLYNRDANRPTIQLSVGSAIIFTNINANYYVHSLILDANSQTTSRCAQMSGEYFNVKAMNGTSGGLTQNGSTGRAILCEATGCSALPINVWEVHHCVAHTNTLTSPTNSAAFSATSTPPGTWSNCIAYGNNCDGFGVGGYAYNCVAYNNAGSGFNAQNAAGYWVNCISENNTIAGYRTNIAGVSLLNCADYNNTGGRFVAASTGKIWANIGALTGSGSFFTNAAGGDFTLNNTAGAGADARAAGFPSAFPLSVGVSYQDIGAVQHEDAGGGGGTVSGQRVISG